MPSDYNMGRKEIEKLNYHSFKTEKTRLRNTQAEIIPIVIGTTSVVAKSKHRYTNTLYTNIHILQK